MPQPKVAVPADEGLVCDNGIIRKVVAPTESRLATKNMASSSAPASVSPAKKTDGRIALVRSEEEVDKKEQIKSDASAELFLSSSDRLSFPQIWVESVCESSEEEEEDDDNLQHGDNEEECLSGSSFSESSRRKRRMLGLLRPKDKVIRSLLTSCSSNDVSFESNSTSSRQNSFQLSSREESVDLECFCGGYQTPAIDAAAAAVSVPPSPGSHTSSSSSYLRKSASSDLCPSSFAEEKVHRRGEQGENEEKAAAAAAAGPDNQEEDCPCGRRAAGVPSSSPPPPPPLLLTLLPGLEVSKSPVELEEEEKVVEVVEEEDGPRAGRRCGGGGGSCEREDEEEEEEASLESIEAQATVRVKRGLHGGRGGGGESLFPLPTSAEKEEREEESSSSSSPSPSPSPSPPSIRILPPPPSSLSPPPPPFHTPVALLIESWLSGLQARGFPEIALRRFARDEVDYDSEDETWFEPEIVRVFDPYYDLEGDDVEEVIEGKLDPR